MCCAGFNILACQHRLAVCIMYEYLRNALIFPEKATSTGIFSRLFWTLQTFKRTRWIFLHLQSSRYASHMYRKLRRVGEKFYIHVEVICLGLCYMYKLENNIFFFFFLDLTKVLKEKLQPQQVNTSLTSEFSG